MERKGTKVSVLFDIATAEQTRGTEAIWAIIEFTVSQSFMNPPRVFYFHESIPLRGEIDMDSSTLRKPQTMDQVAVRKGGSRSGPDSRVMFRVSRLAETGRASIDNDTNGGRSVVTALLL